ncbi:hypothetical protein PAHAL_3G447200 [Panicum hallii]|uniref:AT3G52170-like helix-turn-helix domain-containing protein n=1 Tax=Panicum hallii TaxID=206008 RepID=A0A2T8KLB9_9POAL|nr:uncharacterized protein LOC112883941 isoform X1 [Panicum hallii]PVH62987.1 hypothetical protein PAHAL_3G447200 [Panicum hallii]
MQAAAGSVSWVAAQPSVLGRCGGGGGAPSASFKGRAGGGGGGGGAGVRGVGVVRCCARAQAKEKRPPRVRKSKEERREMVESFINSYRVSNDGKFPSVNLTHKEVGGSYYIVREIVRDVIQENRVLGPGGLDATALSFEDCPDSSEVSMKHEFGQDTIESLEMSDNGQVGKCSVSESSSSEESFSLQNNSISTEILLGSSNILEVGVLKSVVQNGSAAGATLLETNLEKQDEFPSGGPIEVSLNSSEEQDPSFAHVSDSDKDIGLNSQADAHEGVGSIVTDRVILSSESTAVYETNGALLREHGTLPNDSHDGSNDSVVDDANVLAATNGVLQEKQESFHEHVRSNESVPVDDVQSLDGQSSITVSANSINGFNSEPEVTNKTIEASNERSLQDELEQPLLDTICDQQESGGSPVSHPALDTKGLLHTEVQHSVVEVDESQFKKSTSGVTKEEVEATDARHEQGTSTTTTISRRTSKVQQKKDDNLFWLVLRAFVVAISKIWAK